KRIPKAGSGITNETYVGAKLKCMRTLRPRNVIHEIVHRRRVRPAVNKRERRVIRKAVIVHAAELDVLSVGISRVVNALTCVPPAEIVEKCGPKSCGVAHSKSGPIVAKAFDWRSARQIGWIRMRVVAQGAAPKQGMSATTVEPEVDAP